MFETQKIRNGITRIVYPGKVCGYYLEGTEQGILLDTGCGYGDLKEFVDGISRKPYVVVLSHGHVDHAGGAGQFPQVYLNEKDWKLAQEHTQKKIRKDYLISNDVQAEDALLTEPAKKFLPLHDGQNFDLGGLHVQFISLPGHTPGSMAMFVPEERIMLLGDACNSATFLQLPGCLSVSAYRKALEIFDEKTAGRYDTVLYSHPHNSGGPEIVPEMIALCKEIEKNPQFGFPVPMPQWPGAYLAMPVDQTMHRKDGKAANLFYQPQNV